MIGTGAGALRSIGSPCAPSISTSWSCTIFTTSWPGVTDLMTSTPTAPAFTLSVKARTTSSATSASSSARRTSRNAASTSASDSAPRPVSRLRIPPSRSDSESNKCIPCVGRPCGDLSLSDGRPCGRPVGPKHQWRPRAHRAVGRGPPASQDRSAVQRSHLLRERAEPMVGPRGSQGIRPNLRLFCVLWCAYRACRVPLGFTEMGPGQARAGGRMVDRARAATAGLLAGLLVAAVPALPSRPSPRPGRRDLSEPPGHLRRAVSRRRRARRLRPPACPEAVRADGPDLRDREPAGRRNRDRRRACRQGGARWLHDHARDQLGVRDQCHAEQEPALRSGQAFRAGDLHVGCAVPAAGALVGAGQDRRRVDQLGEVATEAAVLRHRRSGFAAAHQHGAPEDDDGHEPGPRALSR